MEGFLHCKPAILFGRSDFASLVTRAQHPDDFPAALQAALTTDWRFGKMLYWYFSQHTLDTKAADFEDRLFARFARAGFDRQRFWLAP